MRKLFIEVLALEFAVALYSFFTVISWNWAFPEKPLNFWVAFCAIHVIRFIGKQFSK